METLVGGRWFEWDDEKARKNKIKHNISFKTAVFVFEDENRVEESERKTYYGNSNLFFT